jgi:anti-anti-sigma regulatory factor
MQSNFTALAGPPSVGNVNSLNLDELTAVQEALAQTRGAEEPRPQLHIDCSQLVCQRTLGVSHVVSQLLMLRKTGASIWLSNVNAPLRRCLRLLRLDALFHLVGA